MSVNISPSHSWSLNVPFESLGTDGPILYHFRHKTRARYCIKSRFFIPHLHSMSTYGIVGFNVPLDVGGVPVGNCHKVCYTEENKNSVATRVWKSLRIHFIVSTIHITHEREGRTPHDSTDRAHAGTARQNLPNFVWCWSFASWLQKFTIFMDLIHSSNEPGELSQWLCHDDSTINIVLDIIIICQYAANSVHSYSNIPFTSLVTNERTNGQIRWTLCLLSGRKLRLPV